MLLRKSHKRKLCKKHKPFLLDGFKLCRKCGEALHHKTEQPLGRPSTAITVHYGKTWKRAVRRQDRERRMYLVRLKLNQIREK